MQRERLFEQSLYLLAAGMLTVVGTLVLKPDSIAGLAIGTAIAGGGLAFAWVFRPRD